MKDPTLNYHGGNSESDAAWQSIIGKVSTVRQEVLELIKRLGAATCDEVEQALKLSHQSASARITELKRDGAIRDSGNKKKTRSGRFAAVYVAVSEKGQMSLL